MLTLFQLLDQINSAKDIQTFAKDNLLKIAESGDGRFILNYNEQQLGTPKSWISHYCRGLTLEGQPCNYQVIAKSFDRFYNIGEFPEYLNGQDEIDWDKPFEVQFKYDGSLILLYHWNGQLRVNTRGSFAQGNVSSIYNDTWEKLFNGAEKTDLSNTFNFFPGVTYIYELCSPHNQVVEYYPTTFARVLGAVYLDGTEIQYTYEGETYNCKSQQDVFNLLETLKPTQEGFVITQWDEVNTRHIRRKCKTKTWAALAHLKDGINSQLSLWKIIFRGDIEEVISIFPHLKDELEKKELQYKEVINSIDKIYKTVQDIKDQKEFAITIKDIPFKASLFSLRNNNCTLVETSQQFILSKNYAS